MLVCGTILSLRMCIRRKCHKRKQLQNQEKQKEKYLASQEKKESHSNIVTEAVHKSRAVEAQITVKNKRKRNRHKQHLHERSGSLNQSENGLILLQDAGALPAGHNYSDASKIDLSAINIPISTQDVSLQRPVQTDRKIAIPIRH